MFFCISHLNYVRVRVVVVFLLLFLLLSSTVGARELRAKQSCASVSEATCTIAHELRRGINFGNMLEAPNEGDWGIRLDPRYIDLIEGKFDTVRVPIRWSNQAAKTEDATIDEFFFNRVEKVVDSLLAKDVYVIINMHHYNQLFSSTLHYKEYAVSEEVVEARLLNMWRQIAERFKDKSPKLLFELLNEPHGKMHAKRWNILSQKVLDVVRKTNPTRAVLIGPTYYNNVRDLPKLILPNDRNIIVSIHSYTPFFFTHQGVSHLPMNMPTGVVCCDAEQRKEIITEFDSAIHWNKENGYPLHLGEFGTYNKADMDSRVEYTRFVRRALEERGIGWAVWEFGSSFGIYDPRRKQWREPLVEALLGKTEAR